MHRKASIYNDPVHKAVWEKHPAKAKGKYGCAKCHSPSDKALLSGGGLPSPTLSQTQEPISCQTCHTIERIEEHPKSNSNVYTKKPKTFFSADRERKGEKVIFHEEKSFLGLFRTTVGSPYHDIDYSNENFYNGRLCMGCHSHKQNAHGFTVCDFEVKKDATHKENCISCHMPQVKGSYANQKQSQTHAYHGFGIVTTSSEALKKYIGLSVQKKADRFEVMIENRVNHPLFPHPLRLGVLKVSVQHEGKIVPLAERRFARIIGKDGKPSSPWLADSVIKDTTIKAYERRHIIYDYRLKSGDVVLVEFGYHIVNPKMAAKLGINDKHYSDFILFKRQRFTF